MSIINVKDLTFAYDAGRNIFENVSFQIDTDWKLGFTGRNGRGKTTFLKLLLGNLEYSGKITASVKFDYFPCKPHDAGASVIKAVENNHPNVRKWELLRELKHLEANEDILHRPFNMLSYGEQTKVLLVILFLGDNNFPLIDEPTNHLDMRGREVVTNYLRRKKGFILVSHDRTFLDGCVDHILSINKTNIEIQRGNFSSWFADKERRDSFELAENEKLEKDIRRLRQSARQASEWSDRTEKTKYATRIAGLRPDRGYLGHKAAKLMGRSKAIEARRRSAAEEKSQLLKNLESSEKLKVIPIMHNTRSFMSLDNVSLFYGERAVCRNVALRVEQGDRIALQGKNGSGKSSLLRYICGEKIESTGEFRKASGLKISDVAQGTSFLSGDLRRYAYYRGIDESLFLAILRKLDFSREQFEGDMSDFSDGQKKKALIAASLCERAHILVWDEPLNFVDVISRVQIEQLLLDYDVTILFTEHDRAFCDNVATKKILL